MEASDTIKFEATVHFTLKCGACSENHQFVSDEVERIVYAMSAMVSDLRDDMVTQQSEYLGPTGEECLKEILDVWSSGSEMYGEHVSAMIEARERIQKEEKE